MSSRRILAAIKFLFFTVVIGTPLFYFKWGIYPYIVPKTAFFQIIVEIIFFLWIALAILDKRYRPRMTPLLWGIALYLAVLTVTAIAGVDPFRSFFSIFERAFGVVLIYHLAALTFVAAALSRGFPWKKIWYASLGTSVVTLAIAFRQLQVRDFLLVETSTSIARPGATFGNPTFLAGYLLLNVFIAGYYLLRQPSRKEAVFLWVMAAVDIAGIFVTQTRGDILGLFAGVIALTAVFAARPPESRVSLLRGRALYIGLLIVFFSTAALVWFTRTSSFWAGVPGFDRFRDISFSAETINNSGLAPRFMAFRAAWKGFLDRPLLGWGPENFNVVFSKYYDPRALEFGYSETNFDKPHSVPLEELVSGGASLFLAYFAVFFLFVRAAWYRWRKDAPLFAIAAAATVAYLVRSAIVFDTIGPAMMLYLFFGFAAGGHSGGDNGEKVKQQTGAAERVSVKPAVVLVALALAAVPIYALNFSALTASHYSFLAHRKLQIGGNTSAAMADFRAAVDPWNPYQWEFVRDYVNTLAQAHFYSRGAIPEKDMLYAIGKMEKVADEHPYDAYNHYLLTSVYNLTSDLNPARYLSEAEKQAKLALALSPGRQEILFYLAKTKSLQGDNAAALAIAKQALDEDPKIPNSHFYYGMLAFATGQSKLGMSEVKAAIALGRDWMNFYEPRVAADYFADAGNLPEAIAFYKTALVLQPGDLETEIKLGAAYFLKGEKDPARALLSDAASRFDFTKSPQYGQYKPILDALGIAARPVSSSPPPSPPVSPPVSPIPPSRK